MTHPAKASTQYGDLTGTISIDGFNGLTIFDLIKSSDKPAGYWPIGLRIYGLANHRTGQEQSPRLSARVLCVDIEQVGRGPDEIAEYVRTHSEIHTFEFDAEIEILDLFAKLKRLDVVLISRIVGNAEVRIQPVQD
jgi:hypothetical protein